MSNQTAKRFWKSVTSAPVGDGFGIFLDERPLRTPSKAQLTLPTLELAQSVAAEWDRVAEHIDPERMPFTRMSNSAIDKVSVQMAEVANLLVEYGDSDLLCYRAEGPASLLARQEAAWDPLLDWANEMLGARLRPRQGVIHAPQNPADIERLRAHVFELTNFELAAFHDLVSLSGSLIIAFAAAKNFRPADALWGDSRIDENWQIERWGSDDIATKDEEYKREAFIVAEKFFGMARLKV